MNLIIGTIKIVQNPKFTTYFWGEISDIAGKELYLLEKNENGDCLCWLEEKGIVDVDCRDIERSNDESACKYFLYKMR